jgi:hypothetical protein
MSLMISGLGGVPLLTFDGARLLTGSVPWSRGVA